MKPEWFDVSRDSWMVMVCCEDSISNYSSQMNGAMQLKLKVCESAAELLWRGVSLNLKSLCDLSG